MLHRRKRDLTDIDDLGKITSPKKSPRDSEGEGFLQSRVSMSVRLGMVGGSHKQITVM